MADDAYDEFLTRATQQAPSTGPVPVRTGAGVDAYDEFLGRSKAEPTPTAPTAQGTDPYDEFIARGPTPAEPRGYISELGRLAAGGVERNIAQWKSMPDQLLGVYHEAQGDTEKAVAYSQKAAATQAPTGESEWSLQKIHDPETFSYWVAEKLGEQSITALATLATGGTAGLGASALSQNLLTRGLISSASARAIMLSGMTVPTYALTTAMETAGTAEEQFQATGSTQPELSIKSGALKGMLELVTPLSIAKALLTPGLQLGKSLPGAIGKLALKEAATETAQEAIDIYARKVTDPSYTFFKDGPTLVPSGWSDGMWRLAESGAAGGLVGAAFGGPAAVMERRQERNKELGTEPPGFSQTVQVGENTWEPTDRMSQEVRLRIFPTANEVRNQNVASDLNVNILPGIKDNDNEKLPPKYMPEGHPDRIAYDEEIRRKQEDFRNNFAQARRDEFRVIQGGPGPVTQLHNTVVPKKPGDKLTQEVRAKDPRDDALGVGAFLLPDRSAQRQRVLDAVEAATDRYAEITPTGVGSRLYTNTEWELENATNRKQSEKPRLLKVNQQSLQPAAITAQLTDLPDVGSERVWFLPGVNTAEKQQLLQQYANMQKELPTASGLAMTGVMARNQLEESFKPIYDRLLTAGLRVIPSHGSGFYYNGVVEGEEVKDLKSTGRSRYVAWYNPTTQAITEFNADMGAASMLEGGILVSIDENKLQKGDVIKQQFVGPNGDVIEEIRLRKSLGFDKLTPGIQVQFNPQEALFMDIVGFQKDMPESKIQVSGIQRGMEEFAAQIQGYVNALLKPVDAIMKSVGINHGIGFWLTDNRPPVDGQPTSSPGWAFVDSGIIGISPEMMESSYGRENLERRVLNVVMHELGHIITYWYYRNLPVGMQDKLQYAWEKGKLALRMQDPSRLMSAVNNPNISSLNHWSTFSEWLAEQFRRWSTSNAEPKSWLDKTYQDGGKQLEKYYRQWEQRFGEKQAANLAEPDYYFSGVMDYLRGFSKEKHELTQLLKRDALYRADQKLLDSPIKFQILKQADLALRSVKDILLPGQDIRFNEFLDPKLTPVGEKTDPDTKGRYLSTNGKELGVIELVVGSLPAEQTFHNIQQRIVHEVVHAYMHMGLWSTQEIGVLLQDIKGKEDEVFSREDRLALQRRVKDYGLIHKMTQGEMIQLYEDMRNEEYIAHYVQRVIAQGKPAYSEQGKGILATLAAVLERIKNFFNDLGFQTKEDVLRAFFKGEMVARYELRARENTQAMQRDRMAMNVIEQRLLEGLTVDETTKVGEYTVKAYYQDRGKAKNDATQVYYYWIGKDGRLDGYIELTNRGEGGFEIGWVQSDAFLLAPKMIQYAEKDLGFQMKVAGELTEEGYQQAKALLRLRRQENVLDLYQKTSMTAVNMNGRTVDFWFSPKELKRRFERHVQYAKSPSLRQQVGLTAEQVKIALVQYKRLLDKLPPDVWSDPRLRQMFVLDRNNKRDEVQGALIRAGQQVEESKLMASLGYGSPMQDVFQSTFEMKQAFSQAENAKASQLPFEMSAPSSALTFEVRRTWEKLTGYGENAETRRIINNTLHEADRIGKFTKYAWTIWQLIWSNEKIEPLRSLGQNTMRMNTLMNGWLRRADETAREWRKITDPKRREGITNTLFGLMEMRYRSAVEVNNNTVRMPMGYVETMPGMADGFLDGRPVTPNSELDRFFKKMGLDPRDHEMIRRVGEDFRQFLRDVEAVRVKNLTKTLAKSPAALAAALADLQREMTEIRSKPYFPMMRWGEFTIKVKDANTKELLEFQAFGTRMQRDAAVLEIKRKHPAADIQVGRVASSSIEFMSLPSPLLKTIKEKLFSKVDPATGLPLSAEQIALIDRQIAEIEAFELANRPDRTFRKRWMPAHGIPGYNTDAFRAYASYFQYGSRYLSRLAYMDDLYADLAALQKSSDDLGNTAKREEMVKYVRDWLKYIMEPGRDSGKFRAFVSLWYLGFSPAAAAMNFTQTLTVTLPTLHGIFGREAVTRSMSAGWTASKNVWRTNAPAFAGGSGIVSGSPSYIRAREEMMRQSFIDVGQAPELAAFAEGGNLIRMQAGTKTQEAWLTTLNYGMKMFSVVEQHNRELAFKLSWDLAMKHPRTPRLFELDSQYSTEIPEIMARANITHQEAVAFVFAREMIQKTQYVYDKTSDAPFMRGRAKDFLIFFKFTQSTLYAFGNNGAMMQMLLVFAFLYGLNGLPGAEDAAAIVDMLDAIGRKLFGKDFRLRFKAREFFTQATAGTPFEKVGPDLALHGVSRYGFGMSFLPTPFAPQFDASSNGSMGRIIPGFAEFMHGNATGKKWPDVFAEAAQKASGAGYGTFFSLMHYLSEGPSADSKKWESLLPRVLKAEAKAWRYGFGDQAETTKSGAKLPSARFFAGDPDDIATVLAQAAGFQPRKVSQTWEKLRAVGEEEEIYKGRRTAIYVQMDKALMERNEAAIAEVKVAIDRYNADVKNFDPAYQIGRELSASLKQRRLQQAMVEETSVRNKKQITIMDRMQKLYPGVEVQKVK